MQLSSGTRYIIEQRIAQGGMGSVYRGTLESPAGRRAVAIKRLLATEQMSADAAVRLTREAQLVFRLNHANVCQVLDLGSDGNEIYVIMEYVHGLDLGRLLQWHRSARTQLEIAHAIYIAREVARALDYAHRRTGDNGALLGLVHGDVAPANILLSVEGEVKLSDFGIARSATASPGNQLRGGTPGYMAPEVAKLATIDHRADLYSLGATLWAALVGRRAERPLDLDALAQRPGVSAELCALVANMCAVDRTRRPVSAAAVEAGLATELSRRHPSFTPGLLGALVAMASTRADTVVDAPALGTLVSIIEPPVHEPTAPQTRTLDGRSRRRWRWLWPVAVVSAIAMAGLVWYLRDPVSPSAPAVRDEKVAIAEVEPVDALPVAPASVVDAATAAPPIAPPPRPSRAPERRSAPARKPAEPEQAPGLLTVTSEPWGAVYVDGTRVAGETPAYQLRTRPGLHTVKIFYPSTGTYSASRSVTVVSGKVVAVGFRRP